MFHAMHSIFLIAILMPKHGSKQTKKPIKIAMNGFTK